MRPVDLAERALGVRAQAVLALVAHGQQLVGARIPHAAQRRLGALVLRIPPAVSGRRHPAGHDGGQLGLQPALAEHVLDPHPLAVADAESGPRLGVKLHHRVGVDLPQPGDVAVLGVEVHRRPPARAQDQRVLLVELRAGDRAEGRLFVVRQRLEAPALAQHRVQLHLARGRAEAGLAVGPQQAPLVPVVGRAGMAVGR